MVAKVLETHWGLVLEEAGFSLPPEASSEDSGKMLEDGLEIGNEYMGTLTLFFSLLISILFLFLLHTVVYML